MKSVFLLLFVSGLAIADDAALLRCRMLADAGVRLACYDALVVTPAGAAPAKSDTKAGGTAAPQAAVAQAAPPPTAQQQFGFEAKLANKDQPDAIESEIPGRFEGWNARSSIRLANGQVWQIADDSSRGHYIDNPKVRIRRGALGAFYLEIQGTNHSPRVRRVQ